MAAPVTLGRLTAARASTGSFATSTLQLPTALSGTGGQSVSLGWTASTSSNATGYNVLRSSRTAPGMAVNDTP